jgi:TusA-related sulfurtransferase
MERRMAAKGQGVMSRRLAGPSGRKVFYSAAVARRVLERVESGEALRSICADPSLPHRATITAWIKRLPTFAAKLHRARTAAGWHMRGGRKPRWDEGLAAEIYYRMSEGESLTAICRDPQMPSFNTVWKWRIEHPRFAEAVALAQRMQAERLCDEGWEIACAVTPENAYATRVQLGQLRWTAAALGPRRFGRFKAVDWEDEGPQARAEPTEVVFSARRFETVRGPDGKAYVREILDQLPPRLAGDGGGGCGDESRDESGDDGGAAWG